MATFTTPAAGQIWQARTGRNRSRKLVTKVLLSGGVYAVVLPRQQFSDPTYYTARHWRDWIETCDAELVA